MKAGRGVTKGLPRWVEVPLALAGLLAASPLLAVSGCLMALTSPGPILFRQKRVGLGGKLFTLYKLRTMRAAAGGVEVTAGDDERITKVGRLLRRSKLDELPELWNVVRGDMSLVGPRPEVPRYVDASDPLWRKALRCRPGLTDPVTLRLRNEESLLASVATDREKYYLETLQPFKLKGYIRYGESRNAWTDLAVLSETALAVIRPGRAPGPSPSEISRAAKNDLNTTGPA